MRNFKVQLNELYNVMGGTLEATLMENPWDGQCPDWKRPAVIVVPGGAYAMVSRREGWPVATEFLTRGFQTFVLTYLCNPDGARYPEQLTELACAVDYVKKNAEAFNVNPDEIFVVGFSAGGHLVANLAVEWFDVNAKTGMELDCKPTAVGLGYPVITKKAGYEGTHDNLLEGYSEEAQAELLKTLNLDEAVTEKTAPSFVWTTEGDTYVPVSNSLWYTLALMKHKVPYELHVYPGVQHGSSTGSLEVNFPNDGLRRVGEWMECCAKFFKLFVTENL